MSHSTFKSVNTTDRTGAIIPGAGVASVIGSNGHNVQRRQITRIPILIKSTDEIFSKQTAPTSVTLTSSTITEDNNQFGQYCVSSEDDRLQLKFVNPTGQLKRKHSGYSKHSGRRHWEDSQNEYDNSLSQGSSSSSSSSSKLVPRRPLKLGPSNKTPFVGEILSGDTCGLPTWTESSKGTVANEMCTAMPNLLQVLSNGNGDRDPCYSANVNSDGNSSHFTGRPTIPIENIFLKKYDPISILTRLRSTALKTVGQAPSKVLICEDFPQVMDDKTAKGSSHSSSNSGLSAGIVKVEACPHSSWSRLEKTANTDGGQSLAPLSLLDHARRRSARAQALKQKMSALHGSRIRCPKYTTPRRKLRVKFYTPQGDLPELKLRILSALYLKRALARLRNGSKFSGSKRNQRAQTALGGRAREKAAAKEDDLRGESGRFPFTLSKAPLPQPLDVPSAKFYVHENSSLIHTVELLRHKRELEDRLETIESEGIIYKLSAIPERPDTSGGVVKPLLTQNVELTGRQSKHIISQQLLINLASIGFTHTKLRPLEIMADVVANFLTKMSERLKVVTELEMLNVDHGFPDAMERVLNELGMGGIRGLEEFYRDRMSDYQQRMEEQCVALRRQYAYKVRSKVGLSNSSLTTSSSTIKSATTPSTTTNDLNCGGGGGSAPTTRLPIVISSSKTASTTTSSSPLSPGNSVLAEILSSQEDVIQGRTPHQSAPKMGVEKQLDEMMEAPPPNVEIRPNSAFRQQLTMHPLLTSLSQPISQQHYQVEQSLGLQPLGSQPLTGQVVMQTGPLTSYQSQQQQTTLLTPALSPQRLNQPHLTQLLQRPVLLTTKQPNLNVAATPGPPTTVTLLGSGPQTKQHHLSNASNHLVLQASPSTSQFTGVVSSISSPGPVESTGINLHQAVPPKTLPNQASQPRSENLSSELSPTQQSPLNSRQILSLPIQIKNISRAPTLTTVAHRSKMDSQTNPPLVKAITGTAAKGKTVTIMGNNVISISLGGNNLELENVAGGEASTVSRIGSGNQQTMTMHAGEGIPGAVSSSPTAAPSSSSSKAKLKEAINQRNLLRLNFDTSSGGDSTVLLSSAGTASPAAGSSGVTPNIQFRGKVNSGQIVSWKTSSP